MPYVAFTWLAALMMLAASPASLAGSEALATGVEAPGGPKRGAELAPLCTGCHGPDGRSNLSRSPSIAGLDPKVFTARMEALQAGESGHLLMRMTRGLSHQDIADLAAHFATLD